MLTRSSGIYYRQDPGGGGGQPAGGQPAAGQGAAGAAGAAAAGAAAAEAWRQHLPEDFRSKPLEEIAQTFTKVHKDFGALNNDVGNYKKQVQDLSGRTQQYEQGLKQWADWWKSVEPHWGGFEKYLQSQQQGGGQQPQAGGNRGVAGLSEEILQNWATLEPQRQAQTLLEALGGQVQQTFGGYRTELQKWLDEERNRFSTALAENQKNVQNYLNLFQRTWEAKQRNPALDVNKAMEEAVNVLSGKIDPLDLGIQRATADQDREAYLAKQKELWEAERKAKEEASRMAAPIAGASPPSYRPSASRGQGAAATKEAIARSLIEKYGSGIV